MTMLMVMMMATTQRRVAPPLQELEGGQLLPLRLPPQDVVVVVAAVGCP